MVSLGTYVLSEDVIKTEIYIQWLQVLRDGAELVFPFFHPLHHDNICSLTHTFIEMVLSVLLEAFIFEPGPPVRWEMGIITVPRLIGSTSKVPQLPLKIRAVN